MRVKKLPPVKPIVISNHKKEKPEWELFAEETSESVDKLVKIYKDNPFYARVIFKRSPNTYNTKRIVMYRFINGDINIIRFNRTYGISITNKMYSSERNECSIIYKKETNKWYYKVGSFLNLLDYNKLYCFIGNVNYMHSTDKLEETKTYKFLLNEIGWLRNVHESENSLTKSIAFNTIIKNKLFNDKAINRHIFKVPTPVNKMLIENMGRYQANGSFILIWDEIRKVLKNVENLKGEFFNNESFMDTCKMAGTLGRVVNCSWSLKRLKLEHDKFAREIGQIVLLHEELKDLNNSNLYLEFANHTGYQICLTNHELIYRGIIMNHCVGSYISNVNNGYSGIFILDDYTFELGKTWGSKTLIELRQLQGYNNRPAPIGVKDKLLKAITDFNENTLPFITLEPDLVMAGDELPF